MMKTEDINKKISEAEKSITSLIQAGDLKKLPEQSKYQIAKFYELKCLNRLETARLIHKVSKDNQKKKLNEVSEGYNDYAEAVAAAYYAMYYIIHAYLASQYKTKLREDIRGVHAITQHIILYYLVKTKKLAEHLYNEYVQTFETTAQIQKIDIEDFQKEAYKYAETYGKSRDAREFFTYRTTLNAEENHAEQAISTAEEFISTIRQLMLTKPV